MHSKKSLPHRPFALAPAMEDGKADLGLRRPSDTSSISSINLTPLKPTFHIPPQPKPARTRQPRGQYNPSHHKFSSSTNTLYTTDSHTGLIPATPTTPGYPRRQSWLRRHWFVVMIAVLATIGIALAVGVVMLNQSKGNKDGVVYVPDLGGATSSLDPPPPAPTLSSG